MAQPVLPLRIEKHVLQFSNTTDYGLIDACWLFRLGIEDKISSSTIIMLGCQSGTTFIPGVISHKAMHHSPKVNQLNTLTQSQTIVENLLSQSRT